LNFISPRRKDAKDFEVICKPSAFFLFYKNKKSIVENAQLANTAPSFAPSPLREVFLDGFIP